nr:hypothetical protein [uncultured Methanospirillum sp.]
MKGRNQALNLIFSERNSDQKLQDHPYNARIKPGKDFGAQESDARYIPAMWLYRGRFVEESWAEYERHAHAILGDEEYERMIKDPDEDTQLLKNAEGQRELDGGQTSLFYYDN